MLGLHVLPGQEVVKGQVIAQLQSSDIAAARSDFEKAKIEVHSRRQRTQTRQAAACSMKCCRRPTTTNSRPTDQTAHSELERTRQRIHELGFSEDSVSDTVALARSHLRRRARHWHGQPARCSARSTTPRRSPPSPTSTPYGSSATSSSAISPRFRPGRAVDIVIPAYPDLKLTGRVANISDALDPNTHTLKLRVVLPNPKHTAQGRHVRHDPRRRSRAQRRSFCPQPPSSTKATRPPSSLHNASGKYDQRAVTIGRTLRLRRSKEHRGPQRPQRRRQGRHSRRSAPPPHQRRLIACSH